MQRHRFSLLSALVLFLSALPLTAAAQMTANAQGSPDAQPAVEQPADAPDSVAADEADNPLVQFPNQRPPDQRGLNVFEPPKTESHLVGNTPQLRLGGAFAQQFQALDHSNTAEARMVTGTNGQEYDANQLMDIGPGFNLATANLGLNALLTDGVQVNLDVYLSSRRHQEAWVKGGYLQVDAARFLGSPVIDRIMEYATLKVGHFEINYGDNHFRRTDNGNAFYNPFIGNYILDAFTTEIGGELYLRHAGFLGMLGVSGGEIKGDVTDPDGRSLSLYGKVGVDRQVTDDLRLRLTGSAYHNGNAASNTLYGGDRAGSRYYLVLENTVATTNGNASSGLINPGFREEVTAFMVNPFVKFRGLELFGTLERVEGRAGNEAEGLGRAWTQYGVDALYRFLPREQVYVGARYNRASGELAGPVNAEAGMITTLGDDVSVERYELAAGWFPTRNVLLKVAYVDQQYRDFPALDIRNGGEFNGFMIEGVLAF
jgi:hypothetical protein